MTPTLMTTGQAAQYLRIHPRTLERYRSEHMGPQFIRQGRKVFYEVCDLTSWQDDNKGL
jgi:DNA-binding transcriptional MerR regulator